MIRGPTGKIVILKIKNPKIAEITPNNGDKILYVFKFFEKFLAEAAGKAVKPATNNPPTNFTPKATIAEIESK